MCLSMDESIHSASRSFASRHSFVFSLPVPPSSFVPFTLTVASDVHYLQLSRRKSVPLIPTPPFFLESEGCSQCRINFSFRDEVTCKC